MPGFVFLVYEFNDRYYIENHDREGIVEGFIPLNKQESYSVICINAVIISNKGVLGDSYVGKKGLDSFLLSENRMYVDTVEGFRELINIKYRMANESVIEKILLKR